MPEQKITTFLWFQREAEEAVRFYTSLFDDGAILSESRWGDGGPVPKGTLMTARFKLAGQEFMAMNGNPSSKFSEATSLLVTCETQAEIDALWSKLSVGSSDAGQCGWLKDKYGVTWQIVPRALGKFLTDQDGAKVKRVSEAMLQMRKLDLAKLQKAYDGR